MLSEFNIDSRVLNATIAAILTAIIGLIPLFIRRDHLTKLFAACNLSLAIWNLGDTVVLIPESHSLKLLFFRLNYISGVFVCWFFYLFMFAFAELEIKKYKVFWKALLTTGIILIILSLTPALVANIDDSIRPFKEIPGPAYPLFIVFLIGGCGLALYQLFSGYNASKGITRIRIKYMFVALFFIFSEAIFFFLTLYIKHIPYYYFYLQVVYALIVAYSIMRHRVIDLGLIFRWGLAYGGSIIILLGTFLFTTYQLESLAEKFLSIRKGIITVTLGCIAAFIFDPMRKKIINFVDRFIFKSPDFQILIDGIRTELVTNNSTESITQNLANQFKNIWHVNHVGFALWDSKLSQFKLYPENTFSDQIINQINETINQTDFLVKTLQSERRLFPYGIVVDEELVSLISRASLGEKTTFSKIRRTLRWIGATACVPIVKEELFLGFIILGPKNNQQIYNSEDKKFLSHVSELLSTKIKQLITTDTAPTLPA